jgi:hypothetical protein
VVLMWGMDSLKELILANNPGKLARTLANLRVISDLSDDATAINELLDEVGPPGQSSSIGNLRHMVFCSQSCIYTLSRDPRIP